MDHKQNYYDYQLLPKNTCSITLSTPFYIILVDISVYVGVKYSADTLVQTGCNNSDRTCLYHGVYGMTPARTRSKKYE